MALLKKPIISSKKALYSLVIQSTKFYFESVLLKVTDHETVCVLLDPQKSTSVNFVDSEVSNKLAGFGCIKCFNSIIFVDLDELSFIITLLKNKPNKGLFLFEKELIIWLCSCDDRSSSNFPCPNPLNKFRQGLKANF